MKSLVKSNGFPTLRTMMEDFWNADGFFGNSFLAEQQLPAVNIKDKKGGFELEVAAPGFKKDDFKVSIENGLLIISADTSSKIEEDKDDYTRREFFNSSFTRSFTLPNDILQDEIKANYKDGLLHITLKKNNEKVKESKMIKIE